MATDEIDFVTLFLKLHNYMVLPWSPSKSFLLMAPKRPEGLIHFFASKTWTLKMSDLEICLYFLSTYTCISKVLERLLFKELVLIGVAKSWSTDEIIHHGSYKWIIVLEKWIICSAPLAIERIKILGAVLELPARQQCQFSPLTVKMGQIGWMGSSV